ncbi:unnamed protein product [Calypogeia fissa]
MTLRLGYDSEEIVLPDVFALVVIPTRGQAVAARKVSRHPPALRFVFVSERAGGGGDNLPLAKRSEMPARPLGSYAQNSGRSEFRLDRGNPRPTESASHGIHPGKNADISSSFAVPKM